jgi:ArsR family transcriptional regulator
MKNMNAPLAVTAARWELYRLLAEPVRLRLLALAREDELAIGELAELLREGQPNVSRHVAPLRKAGLLEVRKQGTRVLVRLSEDAERDAVVLDGLAAGKTLCEADGSLGRVHDIVLARDANAREFFAMQTTAETNTELASELPAYLAALAPLLHKRGLAVDVGTGPGALLDVLAPVYEHVLAVDRELVQLDVARARARSRGYKNVSFVCEAYDSEALRKLVQKRKGADLVFASRVLHHAPRPRASLSALAKLLAPEGALVIIDYAPHENEAMREEQADLWLGFSADELRSFATSAGLMDVQVRALPAGLCGSGQDRAVPWLSIMARRAPEVRA